MATNLALAVAVFIIFFTRPYTDLLPFLIPHRWLPEWAPGAPPLLLLAATIGWSWFRTQGRRGRFLAEMMVAAPVIVTLSVPILPEVLFDGRWMLFTCLMLLLSPVLVTVVSPTARSLTTRRKAGTVLAGWAASFSFLFFMFLLLARGNRLPLAASFAAVAGSLVLAHVLMGGKRGFAVQALMIAGLVPLVAAVTQSVLDMGWHAGKEDRPQGAAGIVVGPYLQNMQNTSVTVMWETAGALPGKVIVSGRKEALLAAENGTADGQCSTYDSPAAKMHEVTVGGLAENTPYHYRVVSNGVAGEIGHFRTAFQGPEPFDFAVYGDSQEMFEWAEHLVRNRHEDTCRGILSDRPQARFVVHVGDMTFLGNEYDRWGREFFGRAREIMRDRVIWPVIGNHELNASWYFDYFSLPNEDEHYYSFDYGNSRFIVLAVEGYAVGHEYGPPTRTPMDPGSPQYEWLKKTLESSQEKAWRFVFFHQGPLASGLEGGYTPARTFLVPLFEQYGVSAVFSGHDHNYEVSVKNNIAYVVTGGGGGPVCLLQPDKRNNPHSRYFKAVWHHCRVHVEEGQAKVEAVDLKGRVFHTVTLNKANGSNVVLAE